jgi:hypothetical protein
LVDTSDPNDDDVNANSFEVNYEGVEEDGDEASDEDEGEDDYTEDSSGSLGTNKSVGNDFENNNSDVSEKEFSDVISNAEESSSDSDSPSIIPVHLPPERLNQAFDEEFHIMERISPEPGM